MNAYWRGYTRWKEDSDDRQAVDAMVGTRLALVGLAELDEDDIDYISASWAESADMSSLHLLDEHLQDVLSRFIYNLMHFCILMRQETVLSVFIYSDG